MWFVCSVGRINTQSRWFPQRFPPDGLCSRDGWLPSGTGSKVRPAVVIQNDKDNARLVNTIETQITGTPKIPLECAQLVG